LSLANALTALGVCRFEGVNEIEAFVSGHSITT
jgi:hypothetical protein